MDFFQLLCVAVRGLEEHGNEGRILDAQLLQHLNENGAATYEEFQEVLDTSNASISRTVSRLSEVNRLGKRGYGLVEKLIDPAEGRRYLVRLSPKGLAWMRAIKKG